VAAVLNLNKGKGGEKGKKAASYQPPAPLPPLIVDRPMCGVARHNTLVFGRPNVPTNPGRKVVPMRELRRALQQDHRSSWISWHRYTDDQILDAFTATVKHKDTHSTRHNGIPRFARAMVDIWQMTPADQASQRQLEESNGEPCLVVRLKS